MVADGGTLAVFPHFKLGTERVFAAEYTGDHDRHLLSPRPIVPETEAGQPIPEFRLDTDQLPPSDVHSPNDRQNGRAY